MTTTSIDAALAAAQDHLLAGRLAQAEAIYRQILINQPTNADARHLLGIVAYQSGNVPLAIDNLNQAIAINPLSATFHNNLGEILRNTGKTDDAIRSFSKALALNPNHAAARGNLALAFLMKGDIEQSMKAHRLQVALDPGNLDIPYKFAQALLDNGCVAQAIGCYQSALIQHPNSVDLYNSLGLAYVRAGKIDEAMECFHRVIALNPNVATFHNNLGNLMAARNRYDEAIACFRKAIILNPSDAMPYSNLGMVLAATGKIDEAIDSDRKAISLKPDFAEAHNNLGNALLTDGRLDEALQSFQKTIQLQASHVGAHQNMLLAMHYHPQYQGRRLFEEHLAFAKRHAEPLKALIKPHLNSPDPSRKIRIGYVSPDLHQHPVAVFLEPILQRHDREHFEITCYSDVLAPDEQTERLKKASDHWRNIVGMSDEDVAALVREDKIDILVDLAGHCGRNRLLVFARKPSPVQVTYLGYQDTTGLSTIDYRITDVHADPSGLTEAMHTEKLVRLPDTFACYLPPAEALEVGPSPAKERRYVTFASFNKLDKVTLQTMEMWKSVLDAVPNSRLVIMAGALGQPRSKRRIEDAFRSMGLDLSRLDLRVSEKFEKYLEFHNQVDIVLDSHPVTGHTTTCHALWMGVPVITLAGTRYAARLGQSVLANLQLEEWAASTPQQYVEIAAHLAGDIDRLAEIRQSLRARMAKSPIVDASRFVRELEKTYRDMWKSWCQQVRELKARGVVTLRDCTVNAIPSISTNFESDLGTYGDVAGA